MKIYILLLTIFLAACSSVSKISLGSLYTPDSTIKDSIQNSLAGSEVFVGANPIIIEVNRGHVKLSGYVKTIRQSDVAGDIATKTSGVREVENNLIVRK